MWILEAGVRQAIEQAQRAGTLPTAQQQGEYEARFEGDGDESGSRVLSIAGTVAKIEVKGILTAKPSFLAMLFGGGNTTYGEILSALAEAEANATVTETEFEISSPGGAYDGLFEVLDRMDAAKKPIKAVGINLVASAAYAIASKADTIVALNRATRIGSVGVMASFEIDENSITVSSSNAPNKNPDVTTEEGQAVVRVELDAMEDIFIEAIASGRSLSQNKVIADFGQGATVLANEALSRGMIDSIAVVPLSVVPSTNSTPAQSTGGNQPEANKMDLQELKAQHPDVYQAAVQQGTEQERDRVGAHLTMGEASGDTVTAFAAIRDGSAMTATLQASYMAAGMNRGDVADRAEDNPDVAASAASADEEESGADVVALVESKLGMEA